MTRTWLVTGSSHGLGRALAVAALEAGDTVVAAARRPEALEDLVDRFGDRVRAVELDPSDPAAAVEAVALAVSAFGRLDVVVNNGGHADPVAIEDLTEESFRARLETDLFGAFHLTRAALPVFRQQRSGHFLQISSIGGRVGGPPGEAASSTASAAVEGFSEVLRREVEPVGIRVTIVEPGVFRAGSDRFSTRQAGPGDPARAARVLVDVVGMEHPPLRLLLGSDALHAAERSSRARAQEAAVWADVSRSTDAAGAGDGGLAAVLHLMVPIAS